MLSRRPSGWFPQGFTVSIIFYFLAVPYFLTQRFQVYLISFCSMGSPFLLMGSETCPLLELQVVWSPKGWGRRIKSSSLSPVIYQVWGQPELHGAKGKGAIEEGEGKKGRKQLPVLSDNNILISWTYVWIWNIHRSFIPQQGGHC